jgi:serine/threonine protein kinase
MNKQFHNLKPLVSTYCSRIIQTSDNTVSKVFYDSMIFRNELHILQSLEHKYIIKPKKHYMDEYKKGVIELPYYKDGDLLSYINKYVRTKQNHFITDKKITMFKQIIESLLYCHTNNIIHGDIKPQNVVLHNLTPILIDFGLSVHNIQFTNHLEKNPLIYCGKRGSEGYMAPEIQDNLIGPCSDVFSTGVLLYNLFTNQLPQYTRKTIDMSSDTIIKYNIPHTIDNLLHDMLQTNYKERPTMEEIYYEYSL